MMRGIPAQGRELELDNFKVLSSPNHSVILCEAPNL